jgi:hypothetical protein
MGVLMKKNVYFISILLIMSIITSGCGVLMRVCHKSITVLKKDTIPFSSLPVEVKEFFYNSRKIPAREMNGEDVLFISNTSYEYELKTIYAVKEQLWTSHYLLIDKTNNITYRINYRRAIYPIIVCNREIFIPTESNIFSKIMNKNDEEIEKLDLNFDRYLLYSDRKYRRIWKKQDKAILYK